MNWRQLTTIVWLRWRLSANQWKKSGSFNAMLGLVLLVLALVFSVLSLFIALALGILLLPRTQPDHLLVLWDVLVIVFLFFWVSGLVTELQRSEALSMDKLLHLPVSPSGAFLLNYLSSLLSLSLVIFVPVTVGLSLALVIVKGPALLVLFPLLGSFLLLVTGLTHQLREWLHLLMLNKRRRRAIIAFAAMAFVLLLQLPNFINMAVRRGPQDNTADEHLRAVQMLQERMSSGELTAEQFGKALAALEAQRVERRRQETQRHVEQLVAMAAVVNAVLPVGWLPYGARAAAEGALWPGLLGSGGALALGCWSLWRSYRTTLRYYTGGFQTGERKQMPAAEHNLAETEANFLERRIRWVPDAAAAVALGGFRSLIRSPEGKMALLSPLILMGLFGGLIFADRLRNIPDPARPMLGLGVVSITMLCLIQLLANSFGMDRNGFRAFVLSPCRRRDILLGKNLAVAPLAIGMCCLSLIVLQLFQPMHSLHFLATLLQMGIAFVLCCLVGNTVSILTPSALSVGSLKPAKAKISTILIHILVAMLSPLVLLPGFAALAAELLVDAMELTALDAMRTIPLYLLASLLEGVLVIWLYWRSINAQGIWLQRREQAILEIVTQRAE